MRSLTVLLVASLCMLPATALAANYDDVADGNWNTLTTWEPSTGYPGAGDVATVDSNTVIVNVDTAADVVLGGGTLQIWQDNDTDITGTITVTADSAIWNPYGSNLGDHKLRLLGEINGTGKLSVHTHGRTLCLGASSPNFTGGWELGPDDPYYSNPTVRVQADQALGTGPVNVNDGAILSFEAVQTYATPFQVNVNAGGEVRVGVSTSNLVFNIDGGTYGMDHRSNNDDFSGTINVGASGMSLGGATSYCNDVHAVSAAIVGTSTITVELNCQAMRLVGDNSATFSGDWVVKSGKLYVYADGALGQGTGQSLEILDGGRLVVNGDQTKPMPALHVNSGGTLSLEAHCSADVTVEAGGKLAGDLFYGSSGPGVPGYSDGYLDGQLIMNGNVSLWQTGSLSNGELYITGTITDNGNGYKLTKDQGRSYLHLQGPGLFSGGFDLLDGMCYVKHVDALGTGSVYIATGANSVGGGRLVTNADGCLDNVAEVVVDAGGVLEFKSTETKAVTVKTGGAIDKTDGDTVFNYSGAQQNIFLEPGAILCNVPTEPTYAEVKALTGGDGVFGLYKGYDGTRSGDYVFGDNGVDCIYRGFAALNNSIYGPDVTITGTVSEDPNSSAGLYFYAQRGGRIDFRGCKLNPTTGNVYFHGEGNLVISGAPSGSFTTIEKNGSGWTDIQVGDALVGKTLNVKGGMLDLDAGNSLAGSTVTVENGAYMGLDVNVTDLGNLTIKAGGVLHPFYGNNWSGETRCRIDLTDPTLMSQLTMEKGSVLMLRQYSGMWNGANADLPGAGTADYVMTGNRGSRWANLENANLVLGDGCRLTGWGYCTDSYGPFQLGGLDVTGSGEVKLAPGATSGMICAPRGGEGGRMDTYYLSVYAPIKFGTGKLVIGDPNDYTFTRYDDDYLVQETVSQDGKVWLGNANNEIGSIEVMAGGFLIRNSAALGGASQVILHDGTWEVDYWGISTYTVATEVMGTGTVRVGYNLRNNSTIELKPDTVAGKSAAIAPGFSAGTLVIDGNLKLSEDNTAGSGTQYGQYVCSVVSDGGVAGVDFDRVDVVRTATVSGGQVVVDLPIPSVELNPSNLGDMTILTAATVSGTFGAEPVLADDTNKWWALDGANAVTIDTGASPNEVVLHGSAISWEALLGDANLDGTVGIADLGALADNYGVTVGATWLQGDFNFDGKVGIADLGALADHYGETLGGGAAAVPEPAGLALLALGAVALVRRRRR